MQSQKMNAELITLPEIVEAIKKHPKISGGLVAAAIAYIVWSRTVNEQNFLLF